MAKQKIRVHQDYQQNEIQNAVLQNANATPTSPKTGQFWFDTVDDEPKIKKSTGVSRFGVIYSEGTGIDIENDTISIDTTVVATQTDLAGKQDVLTFSTGLTDTSGTITVTDYDKIMKNSATVSTSLSLLGTCKIGTSIALGYGASVANGSIIDEQPQGNCIAIGYNATIPANKNHIIQIGSGNNSTNNSLQIEQYQMLNLSTGLIPDDRLSSNIARTSAIPTVNNATLTIQKNGTTVDTFTANASSNKTVNITVPTAVTDLSDASNYALVSSVPTTVAELSDSANYALKEDVEKVFNPSGTVASASDLPTLSSSVLGNIYRVTSSFNTTSDFVEGSGKPIQIGNDIVVVNTGTDANPTYKFNVWGDFIDLSGYQLSSTAVTHTASTKVGDTNKPVYIAANGVATACTYELNKSVPSNALFTDTDTKNTAGSTDTSSKIYLVGATSQAANPQTYSHDTAFVDTNGRLNSAAPASNANDTTVATTKWVKDQSYITGISSSDVTTALGYTPCKKLTADNTALTASGGQVTWEITNTLATADIGVHVYEKSTGEDVTSGVSITVTSSKITIKMNASSNVSAATYRMVAIG